MGKLVLTVQKDNADPIDYAVQIADADIDRLARAYAASHFPNGVTEGDTVRAPTSIEVVAAIANGLAQGMMANVMSFERSEAAKAAVEAIQTIEAKPI